MNAITLRGGNILEGPKEIPKGDDERMLEHQGVEVVDERDDASSKERAQSKEDEITKASRLSHINNKSLSLEGYQKLNLKLSLESS